MSLSSQLYRILVPKPIRTKLLLTRLKKEIPTYHLASRDYEQDEERKEVVEFVQHEGVQIFPYQFTRKYNKETIEVFQDETCGLKYVLMEEKKLYFKRKWSVARIKKSFHDLTLEQDEMSPHRYLSNDFNLDEKDVLADFGAAEGNFTLSVIERIKRAYLFECDPEWIEALEMTFRPWKDKVEIVPKFVSDEAKDLISCILNTDPEKRYKIDDIRKHPWFNLVECTLPKQPGTLVGRVTPPFDP